MKKRFACNLEPCIRKQKQSRNKQPKRERKKRRKMYHASWSPSFIEFLFLKLLKLKLLLLLLTLWSSIARPCKLISYLYRIHFVTKTRHSLTPVSVLILLTIEITGSTFQLAISPSHMGHCDMHPWISCVEMIPPKNSCACESRKIMNMPTT